MLIKNKNRNDYIEKTQKHIYLLLLTFKNPTVRKKEITVLGGHYVIRFFIKKSTLLNENKSRISIPYLIVE